MENSPFPYQGPLSPEQVQGRDEAVADLIERVTERRVTALLGPRRYGKTSLLRRVAYELTEVTTVWVDLYEVASLADVVARFDDAVGAIGGSMGDVIRRAGIELSVQIGLLGVKLVGPAADRPDPTLALRSLLQVVVRAAATHPTMLVMDEFSSISRVEGAAGILRTALQHSYRDLGIVFAGSQPSMMRTLFTDRPQPFYGQADLVEAEPLSALAVEDIVAGGFADSGRRARRLGGLIYDFGRGHPQRTMQLADACWRRTPAGGDGSDYWADGLEDLRTATNEGMERIYSLLNTGEQDVLRSVARTGSIYGRQAALLNLSKGTATHARRRLLDEGDLVDTPAGLRLVDPVMADWLRRRFTI